ncbi:MAG: TIM44-like domain-containing protein [Myxococcaceae bacterium]|nr:TIM44-like domain-containing protein [Myxococcaceae bacterium]
MKAPPRWIYRLAALVPLLVLIAWPALARVGSGESYDSGRRSGSGDDGALLDIAFLLIRLAIEYPCLGIPLLIIFVVGVWYWKRQEGSASTRKALDAAEAQRRTTVSSRDAEGWVQSLKAKDPAFDLMAFFDRTRRLFVEVQEAWFLRDLEPVRRYLSDSTFTRLATQLRIMQANGVRDAIADVQVLDLQIIGLEQSQFFDSVHVRIKASLRDDDAPATATDEQARALAQKKAPETFTEVWTFLRRPGVATDPAKDLAQGHCPNCGAPFSGGAANTCEHCGAIVNSGQYDWVLAEITQGSEYVGANGAVEGLARARQRDPELTTEVLEDRASFVFWRWIDAQIAGDPSRLSKVAAPEFVERLKGDLDALSSSGRQKVFVECAVGAVNTLAIADGGDHELAHVEIRWSAKMGIGPKGQRPPALPSVPQRWVFTFARKAGAHTPLKAGVSTARCSSCSAPLTDNASTSCEYCGAALASGEADWVLREVSTWEGFGARLPAPRPSAPRPPARVPDRDERERLVYLMAAMAAADGTVDESERKLLKMAAERWGVPWANVELSLNAGPGLFDKLLSRGSAEAEAFLRELVQMAMVDGQIDRKERRLLEAAAGHLGLGGRLEQFLR